IERDALPRSRPGATDDRKLGRGLQHGEAAFLARLQDAGALRGTSHRNRPSRCATQKLRVLAGCSHRAERRINRRGSNRRWMKVQWQVSVTLALQLIGKCPKSRKLR